MSALRSFVAALAATSLPAADQKAPRGALWEATLSGMLLDSSTARSRLRAGHRAPCWVGLVGLCSSCASQPAPSPERFVERRVSALPSEKPRTVDPAPSPSLAGGPDEEPARSEAAAPRACPEGMLHVQTSFCPDLERECIRKEYDAPNRITICHAYREGKSTCKEPRVPLDYCIDEMEYPNVRGQKPPVMLSFFEAEAGCASAGKRLCLESEWVAACEGPDETPFPYGFAREPTKCNFDNKWVDPNLKRVYSKDPDVQRAELERLDRSLPSGARPECKSGFGMLDSTGNVDEWVRADRERKGRRSKQAALKGGAWGHVRNACRPVTTSHSPDFEYYFIGTRCCADVTR